MSVPPDAPIHALDAVGALEMDRDRDLFLRELIGELAETLEQVVGLGEAAGFISLVGARIGAVMNDEYRLALGVDALDLDHLSAALVDLKRRIQGGFSIESIDDDTIVLRNTTCPFGDKVHGRSSLCMMTSTVFGKIAAENLGYARLEIPESIAKGDAGCRVVIYLKPPGTDGAAAGREYFAVNHV